MPEIGLAKSRYRRAFFIFVLLGGYIAFALAAYIRLGFPYYTVDFKVKKIAPFDVEDLFGSIVRYGMFQPISGDQSGYIEIVGGALKNDEVEKVFIPPDVYHFNDSTVYTAYFSRSVDVFNAPFLLFQKQSSFQLAQVRIKATGQTAATGSGLFLSPGRADKFLNILYFTNRGLALFYLYILYAMLADLLRPYDLKKLNGRRRYQTSIGQMLSVTLFSVAGWLLPANYYFLFFQDALTSEHIFFGGAAGFIGLRWLKRWLGSFSYLEFQEKQMVYSHFFRKKTLSYDDILFLKPLYQDGLSYATQDRITGMEIDTPDEIIFIRFRRMNLQDYGAVLYQETERRAHLLKTV